jgi:hypothetical protein
MRVINAVDVDFRRFDFSGYSTSQELRFVSQPLRSGLTCAAPAAPLVGGVLVVGGRFGKARGDRPVAAFGDLGKWLETLKVFARLARCGLCFHGSRRHFWARWCGVSRCPS